MANNLNFWQEIKKPIFALAPMEDVTDTVFREIVMSVSNPDYLQVLFTEFTPTDGMCHPVGKINVSKRLNVSETETELLKKNGVKLVAQIWGSDPKKFHDTAKMITNEWNFDGIDINMGCPVKKIVKHASCSALIGYPELAKEIVYAVKEATTLPVSIKTRTGINDHITETWLPHLFETKPDAITLHARTQQMQSDFPAEWAEMAKASKIRDEISPSTLLLGNGDLLSMDDCNEKLEQYNIDGVMIGRGIFHDPWIFNSEKISPDVNEKLNLLWKHTSLFNSYWGYESDGYRMNFNILKRFYKIYSNGFYGAAALRNRLMLANNINDVKEILKSLPLDNLKLES